MTRADDQARDSRFGGHPLYRTILSCIVGLSFLWMTRGPLEPYFDTNIHSTTESPHLYTCAENPGHNLTIVTGFFDIGREWWSPGWSRSLETYARYGALVLGINAPMVIFVEPQLVPLVTTLRRGKLDFTKIIPTSKYDLELSQHIKSIRRVMKSSKFRDGHQILHHPEGFSPFYNVITNSKIYLTKNVTDENPFDSEYFYWLDFGYGHGNISLLPKSCSWMPRAIMKEPYKNMITYLLNYDFKFYNIQTAKDIMKHATEAFIMGGFFGGSAKAIEKYYHLHKRLFLQLLDEHLVDDDQSLAAACYFEQPVLFHFVRGSWFDAFNVLDKES